MGISSNKTKVSVFSKLQGVEFLEPILHPGFGPAVKLTRTNIYIYISEKLYFTVFLSISSKIILNENVNGRLFKPYNFFGNVRHHTNVGIINFFDVLSFIENKQTNKPKQTRNVRNTY